MNSRCLIFKSNDTVHITGKNGNIFILSSRYESDDLNDLYYVGSFPVNGELLTCPYSKDISIEKIRNYDEISYCFL